MALAEGESEVPVRSKRLILAELRELLHPIYTDLAADSLLKSGDQNLSLSLCKAGSDRRRRVVMLVAELA